MNKEMKKLIEKLGWSVEEEGEQEYRLEKFSPANQDFSIRVSGEDSEEIINSIYQEAEAFDVSYQTYIWLDETGHGRNGAPYELEDVLHDMKECKKMIFELHAELSE